MAAKRLGMYETGPDGRAGWEVRRDRIKGMHTYWRAIQEEMDYEDSRYTKFYDDFLRCWRVLIGAQMKRFNEAWGEVEAWVVRSDLGKYHAPITSDEGVDDGWLDIDSYFHLGKLSFTLWTANRVYFPYYNDNTLLCGSMPRYPTREAGVILASSWDRNRTGYLHYGDIGEDEDERS